MKFLFFFLMLPVLELWLLIKIGIQIGALYTIALLFLSAILGIKLLQLQGFSTLLKINQKINLGENPAQEAIEGIMLAMAGALFLFPGFATDVMAIVFVIPSTRHLIAGYWLKKAGFVHVPVNNKKTSEDIIEGEFRREMPEDKRLP